jgi:chromosome segregation ATPase
MGSSGEVIRLDAERPDADLREALLDKHREAARERVAAAALRRRLEWLEQRLATLAGDDDERPADAAHTLDALHRHEAERVARIAALEAQHAALEARLADATTALAAARERAAELERQVDAHRTAAGSEAARRAAAESQLADARRRIGALDRRVADLTSGRLYRLGKRWWRLRQTLQRRRRAVVAVAATTVTALAAAVVALIVLL